MTPDAMKAGGLMETRLIAQMAQIKEMVLSPHNIGSPIGTVAHAHVAASVPNFGVLEFHGHDVPIWAKTGQKEKRDRIGFHFNDGRARSGNRARREGRLRICPKRQVRTLSLEIRSMTSSRIYRPSFLKPLLCFH